MESEKKLKILFFGDSITQAATNNRGYIYQIQHAIEATKKQALYHLIGAGINGNKVYDLYLRLQEDVLDKKPDIVVIYIGINDVWHKMSGVGTDIEKFEVFYLSIINKLQAEDIKVAVCTTSVIGEKKNEANPQDADLDAYSVVIRKLAKKFNCLLIDLRAAFIQYEIDHNSKNKSSGILTIDTVHLNDKGNQLVADEIIKVLSNSNVF